MWLGPRRRESFWWGETSGTSLYSTTCTVYSTILYSTVLSGVSRREKTTELVYWDGTGSEKGEKLKYPSQ